MPTNEELKSQIDTEIISKTEPASVKRAAVGNMGKRGLDYTDQRFNEVTTPVAGPAGPIGNPGPQGNPGPIGPAGLTWKGQWVSATSYLKDDVVGYNGASWFCVNATSGIITPNLDPTNWALLAAQGAQGIQGVPGNSNLNYKKLVGKLTQSGLSAPVMTIFENTFEGTPTIAYASVGGYVINLPGTNDYDKLYCIIGDNKSNTNTRVWIGKATNGVNFLVFVKSLNNSNNTPQNDMLNDTPFEVRIYN